MGEFITPFAFFIVASVAVVFLAAAIPFALWYYMRAKEIAPLLVKKAALESVIENIRKDIAQAREQLDRLAEEKADAEDKIKQKEIALKWLEDNQVKIDDLRVQVAKTKEEFEIAKAQLEDVSQKVSEKRNELAELNTRLLATEERLAGAEKAHLEKLEQIDARRDEVKKDVDRLGAEKISLLTEKDLLTRSVQEFETKRGDLARAVGELEKQLEAKTEQLKHFVEEKTREVDEEISRKRREFEEEVRTRRQQLELELQKRRDDFSRNLADQTRQLTEMQQKQMAQIEEDIKRLERRREELKDVAAEYEVKSKKIEELLSEEKELVAAIDRRRVELEKAKISIAAAEAFKIDEANMWKDLERTVSDIYETPAGANVQDDEEKALEYFQQGLDESGYAFNERTVKAFHTGLLCGDVSPLVVLSGISGTGKSLLPELYAKAFGMNFLPVAVQPRWDGPQDVFGFYNHMERRYKATELSRLIWQYDIFNNPAARECGWKDDQFEMPMSLVLLDEMNLARVEYYFSELLSKLEIRNRISDPNDPQSRLAAEIELEYGASSLVDAKTAQTHGRRLFVWHNILFVGTMNEDESTQSLSSKVIDRSNVLRFGTPESLRRVPNPDAFKSFCTNFVSFGAWNEWRTKKSEELPGINDYIAQMKAALKSVDCGFGHRTERAIRRYVDLYPGSKKDALADQIEMKILPKLNGIDADLVKNNVSSKILEVLAAIEDKDVSEALKQNLSGDSTFFAWKGVRR